MKSFEIQRLGKYTVAAHYHENGSSQENGSEQACCLQDTLVLNFKGNSERKRHFFAVLSLVGEGQLLSSLRSTQFAHVCLLLFLFLRIKILTKRTRTYLALSFIFMNKLYYDWLFVWKTSASWLFDLELTKLRVSQVKYCVSPLELSAEDFPLVRKEKAVLKPKSSFSETRHQTRLFSFHALFNFYAPPTQTLSPHPTYGHELYLVHNTVFLAKCY